MPSTLSGLLIFVYILIPGYCYYAVRRRLTPTRRVTSIVDAANAIFVAMVTNALMLVIYGITQVVPWIREHSPSVVHLLRDSSGYLLHSNARLAYLGTWATILLIGSSAFATALAFRSVSNPKAQPISPIRKLWERYPARVVDVSVWDYYFHNLAPDDSVIYLECHLHDSSYAAGILAWYNTDIDDSPDRDLVLSRPLTVTSADGSALVESGYDQHVILSARDIRQMIVTYVDPAVIEAERQRRSNLESEELNGPQED